MNRELFKKGLAEAEHRAAKAERHLACQLEFVARLERDGRDPSQAMHLLQEFEELQALQRADRDRLRRYYAFSEPTHKAPESLLPRLARLVLNSHGLK